MKTLSIHVQGDGKVTIELDGVRIGLIQELTLEAVKDGAFPKVSITFINPNTMPPNRRQEVLKLLEYYLELVSGHPFIRVFDKADTLPSGMPAVREEEP